MAQKRKWAPWPFLSKISGGSVNEIILQVGITSSSNAVDNLSINALTSFFHWFSVCSFPDSCRCMFL